MTATLIKNPIQASGRITSVDDIINLTQTIKLNDNMPSVREILFIDKKAIIKSAQTENGVLSIKGEVHTNIFYAADTGKAESISAVVPFDYIRECSFEASETVISATVSDCEINSFKQRRGELRLEVTIKGLLSENATIENFEKTEDIDGVITKKTSHTASTVKTIQSSSEHEFLLDADKKENMRIIYAGCGLYEQTSTSSRAGILFSAMVKTEMILAYENEEGEYEYECMSDTFGINTMIETNIDSQFDSYSIHAEVSTEAADVIYTDSSCSLCVNAKVYFEAVFFSDVQFEAVSDIYSTEKLLIPAKENIALVRFNNVSHDEVMLSGSSPLSNDPSVNIIGCSASEIKYEDVYENGVLTVSGELTVSVLLFKRSGGEFTVVNIAIPFSAQPNTSVSQDDVYLIKVDCDAPSCGVSGNKLNAKAAVNISCISAQNLEYAAIKDIEVSEYSQNDDSTYCIKVYYYSEGKELWDLAKENRTSIEKILTSNGISDISELTERMPLIIK